MTENSDSILVDGVGNLALSVFIVGLGLVVGSGIGVPVGIVATVFVFVGVLSVVVVVGGRFVVLQYRNHTVES
jgi:hypothetical protein